MLCRFREVSGPGRDSKRRVRWALDREGTPLQHSDSESESLN